MALEKLTIPDLGDSENVEVIEVLVAPGDEIQENDSILVLETDKAAMEIPATSAGVIKEVMLKVGDTVNQGDEMVSLEAGADGSSAKDDEEPESADNEEQAEEQDSAEETEKSEEADHSDQNKAEAGDKKATDSAETRVEEIAVPDLGSDEAAEIIDILVAVGDEVKTDDGLMTLETDKAAMDVPSPFAGKITEIKVKTGDKVKTGVAFMLAETSSGSASSATSAESASKESSDKEGSDKEGSAREGSDKESSDKAKSEKPDSGNKQQSTPQQTTAVISPADQAGVYAGPAVRKLARELGVDLTQVKGSGTKNRIVKEDVHDFVKNVMQGGGAASTAGFSLPAGRDIDFSQFGEIEEKDLSKLHQVTARNMAQNWLQVPHVTQFEEADVTELEEFRAAQKALSEKKGIKLSPLPFIVKACALALTEFPQFNVSLHSSGNKLIQKKYVHIGVAVATDAGLMVPVIRDVDQLSIWEIAAEITELSELARQRKLTKEHMSGGCFTVSSLGNLGGLGFTPIVNAPEVAILGVSKTEIKPVWKDNEFVPRKILPFSLSYDHRAVNGVDGGLFCQYLNSLLSDIRNMVL